MLEHELERERVAAAELRDALARMERAAAAADTGGMFDDLDLPERSPIRDALIASAKLTATAKAIRNQLIREAIASGETPYQVAKHLGISQSAVTNELAKHDSTDHLLRSPANRASLERSIEQVEGRDPG